MATAKPAISPDEAKETRQQAILDEALEILRPHLDAMSDDEERDFLRKLEGIATKSDAIHRTT